MGLDDVSQIYQMILEYVAACAGISGFVSESRTVIVGDNDDLGVWMLCEDSPGRGQAIEAPQLDVHQDPVRHVLVVGGDGICSVVSLDHLYSQVVYEASDHLPHPAIVFHDQHNLVGWANHLGARP